mmetsp:Transcript_84721/g.220599  ORF Transcript_84721/g.220599 Transcript_84721/m.220599 type:complete len:408 (-) Transcript_84721:9-1232(-)
MICRNLKRHIIEEVFLHFLPEMSRRHHEAHIQKTSTSNDWGLGSFNQSQDLFDVLGLWQREQAVDLANEARWRNCAACVVDVKSVSKPSNLTDQVIQGCKVQKVFKVVRTENLVLQHGAAVKRSPRIILDVLVRFGFRLWLCLALTPRRRRRCALLCGSCCGCKGSLAEFALGVRLLWRVEVASRHGLLTPACAAAAPYAFLCGARLVALVTVAFTSRMSWAPGPRRTSNLRHHPLPLALVPCSGPLRTTGLELSASLLKLSEQLLLLALRLGLLPGRGGSARRHHQRVHAHGAHAAHAVHAHGPHGSHGAHASHVRHGPHAHHRGHASEGVHPHHPHHGHRRHGHAHGRHTHAHRGSVHPHRRVHAHRSSVHIHAHGVHSHGHACTAHALHPSAAHAGQPGTVHRG